MASSRPIAVVTGAAQGIGFAISDRLLYEGYNVCLADINEEKGNESLAELQKKYPAGKAIQMKCNVSSKTSFEEVFTKTRKEFGRIDLLVNNAGILDEYDCERMVAINLMGTINGIQLALKFMGVRNGGKGGAVVNVASSLGLFPTPYAPVYTATKHGIVGLTRSYGQQGHLDENGIFFMAICPSAVRTPLFLNTSKPLKPMSEILNEELIESEYIAEGVMKLLNDKRNGSTLLATNSALKYIDIQDELMKIIEEQSNDDA